MILRSPIFRKLLWISLLPTAVTLVLLDFYLSRYIADREIETVRHGLAQEASILLRDLRMLPPAQLRQWAGTMDSITHTRVTVIDPRGVVLADSQQDPAVMENHANRPEIQQAIRQQEGTSIRHSATLNRDLLYFAVRFNYGSQTGSVLRLAVPLRDIDAVIGALRWRIVGGSLAAAVSAFLIAYLFSRSLTRRITRLRHYSESLVNSRFSESIVAEPHDELGALADSLNQMSRQLRDLINRLSEQSERHQAILTSMVEGVLAVDNQLRATFYNNSFKNLLRIQGPIREPVPLVELVRDSQLVQMLKEVLSSQQAMSRRLQLALAENRTFEAHASLLGGSAQRGVILILHDITDLERLERVRKDFVANVSHELRTPLTAICGYAETLLDGALDDKEHNRQFVEIIDAHAKRLNRIASDLLTLSELESGKRAAVRERLSVAEIMKAAVRTIEPEAQQRNIKVICDGIEEGCVTGYRFHFEQAVLNLLQNAIKFNRPGGEVRLSSKRIGPDKISIAFSDTGIGIPSEDLSRIFERFYRVDKARSREVGGTGLGLAIVKHAIERMNGTVEVESQLGRGSEFRILLPVCA